MSATTIARLVELAELRGWTVIERGGHSLTRSRVVRLARGNRHVSIEYGAQSGSVLWAARASKQAQEMIGRHDKGKAATVEGWLTAPAPGSRRSTSNSNRRGNTVQRRRRRQWLVDHYGDGTHVACYLQLSTHCLRVLDVDTVSADRIVPGGSYVRENVQPACGPCQREQGGRIGLERRQQTG